MAIIWPYRASVSSYVAAGRQIEVPPQRCPTCQRQLIGWGGYWRWVRAPLVVERIWVGAVAARRVAGRTRWSQIWCYCDGWMW